MTDQTAQEAAQYVERSIKSQERLGYKRPPQTVVRTAIKETAAALENLKRAKR